MVVLQLSEKTLPHSKLVYDTLMVSFPSSSVCTVNQANKCFIGRKTTNIKHTAMIGPREKGRTLNMPDFEIVKNSLKVSWIRRLNDSANPSWSTIPLVFLINVGGRFLVQCNFDLSLLRVDIPIALYKEVLEAW